MNNKIIIIITISAILIIALLCFLLFNNNKNKQDIISILKLPITEDQILKKESRVGENNSTILILHVEHDIQFERYSLYDKEIYKGADSYNKLVNIVNEYGVNFDEVEIREYPIGLSIKDGLFSEVGFTNFVYIIKGNGNTFIYTNIPKGVVLPYDYRPQ